MARASDHQRNVRDAMEGNLRAYFHPFEDLVAFVYPNGEINIYNSRTWQNTATMSIGHSSMDNERIIKRAESRMQREGFDRKGRLAEEM